VKCVLHKGGRFTVDCAVYSWETSPKIGLDALFDSVQGLKGLREKKGEVKSSYLRS
jgi:hypothetical protein